MYCPTSLILDFLLRYSVDHRALHSFPTRRSSDLRCRLCPAEVAIGRDSPCAGRVHGNRRPGGQPDRKSTRLNSSHLVISYAVFCLKKKNKKWQKWKKVTVKQIEKKKVVYELKFNH